MSLRPGSTSFNLYVNVKLKYIYEYIFKYKNRYIIDNILSFVSYNELTYTLCSISHRKDIEHLTFSKFKQIMHSEMGPFTVQELQHQLDYIIEECNIIFNDNEFVKHILNSSLKAELYDVVKQKEYLKDIRKEHSLKYKDVINQIDNEVAYRPLKYRYEEILEQWNNKLIILF